MEPGTKKTLLIIGAVVLVIIIIAVVYYAYNGGKGNQYASGATLKKIKGGNYQKWSDANPWGTDANRTAANAIANTFDPAIYAEDYSNGSVFTAAWLKGMGIAYTPANINEFKTDIQKFVKNTTLRAGKEHWKVTIGSFLSDTTAPAS